MKTTVFALAILLFLQNCKAQNIQQDTIMHKQLDLEALKKKADLFESAVSINGKVVGSPGLSYEEAKLDGTHVKIFGNAITGYAEYETPPPPALFYTYRKYYPSGKLHYEGKSFIQGGYHAGIWRTYDEQGKLTEEKDYEKPFTFTIEQVLAYMKAHNIPLDDERTEVYRDVTAFGPEWSIRYDDKENARIGFFTLHGETGALLGTSHHNYPE